MQNITYYKLTLGVLLLSWFISGCATPTHKDDPFEKMNRGVFAFNKKVDKAVVKPIAKGYRAITPDTVEQGVSNFFNNIDDIIVVANDLMQFKLEQAASDSGRFLINSTVGLLGFFDVATKVGLPKHDEDFGQTLGYWGISSGPYLMLPILGPSSARDAVGLGGNMLLDPRFYYVTTPASSNVVIASSVVEGVDTRAGLLESEKVLRAASLDEYSYMRDAYLARRQYLVHDGNPPKEEEEESLFDDEDEDELFAEEDEENEEDLEEDIDEEEGTILENEKPDKE
ncbi:VacJ family lipoprotein [Candidatus Parabeggiatoa sp. HSG14]|uniref:MlaA family lipoprotein n=1 Tax=Candidatus Parabeggiatoa sp. HSG14 TaxID=3055593 RepID=UPI0025A6F42B|nr:VacJ family lipoprotein [Thiotrichales bacterium HSG14]